MSARVLVVDDSPVTVQLITEALAAAGIAADAASDLASLDRRLSSTRYDVMLVDVNMPEMYGDDVVEFLRAQRKLTGRLYLYSELSEAELDHKAAASGADGFITKSSGLEAAVRLVSDALASLSGSRRRVLVVHPDPQALDAELTRAGLEVLSAPTAEEATKTILKKKTRPELVVVGVEQGAGDLLRFIKANSLFAHIRIVLLHPQDHPIEPLPPEADLALPLGADLGPRLVALLSTDPSPVDT